MGARYLIDTHILIWALAAGPMADRARELLGTPSEIVVSAVSAFEVSLKVRLGRLDSARELDSSWHDSLARLQATGLDVSVTHALRAGRLDWKHWDPFDRLLVAQAQVESLPLVTADRAMLSAPNIEVVPW